MSSSPKGVASMSPDKRRLFQRLLQQKGLGRPSQQTIYPSNDEGPKPLSFAQEGLWFLDQFDPGRAIYNNPGAVRLMGRLDVSALGRALSEITKRHEALRTTFSMQGGKPFCVVGSPNPPDLPVVNLEGMPETAREKEALRLATEEAQKAFNLARGPLFRAFLLRLGEQEHILVLNIHHIVTDGWSMGVFNQELIALYEAYSEGLPSPLPELPIQYGDYAVWQREWLLGEAAETQLSYWKRQLSGDLPVLQLPTDRPHPPIQTCRGAHQTLSLSKPLSEALRMLARRENVTLFVTMLAAFKTILYYHTGQEDIVVGSPFSNRNRTELEGLIGYFVNMLALRTDLSGDPSFRELLNRLSKVATEANAHSELPFGKLVEEIQPKRDPSRNPIFQVEFTLLNHEHGPAIYGYGFRSPIKKTLEFSGLTMSPLEVESGVAKFDLVVLLWDMPDGISGTFEYNTDIFNSATVTGFMKHYESLLNHIVAQPSARLNECKQLLAAADGRQRVFQQQESKESNVRKLTSLRRKAGLATKEVKS